MLEKAAAAAGTALEPTKQQFLKQAGIGRFGAAEEIADAMVFCAVAGGALDDRHRASYRRRRGEVGLTGRFLQWFQGDLPCPVPSGKIFLFS